MTRALQVDRLPFDFPAPDRIALSAEAVRQIGRALEAVPTTTRWRLAPSLSTARPGRTEIDPAFHPLWHAMSPQAMALARPKAARRLTSQAEQAVLSHYEVFLLRAIDSENDADWETLKRTRLSPQRRPPNMARGGNSLSIIA